MRWNRQPRKLVLFGGIALVVAFGVLCVLTPYFDEENNRSRRCLGLMNPVIEAALQLRQDGEMLPFTSDGRLNLFELAPEVCSDKDFAENVFLMRTCRRRFSLILNQSIHTLANPGAFATMKEFVSGKKTAEK